jgi:hypothetical protein
MRGRSVRPAEQFPSLKPQVSSPKIAPTSLQTDALRIGVAVVQTFGGLLNAHPRLRALATRAGWDRGGTWLPVPCLDESAAEWRFKHKVAKLPRDAGLLSEKRIELLLSWRCTTTAPTRTRPAESARRPVKAFRQRRR